MSKAMHSPNIIASSSTIDDCAELTWAPEGFFEEMRPQWKFEPSIDVITTIARRELAIGENSNCTVEFLAKGTFNKVYVIHCEDKNDYIMRVSLPVQPHLKTLSEHATIKYIRQHTSLPVPQVIASDARNNNELGFEWMIMQRVPGDNLREQWRHMSWMKKELLVRKVIDYQVQLFRKRFHHIGNIYDTTSLQALSTASVPVTVPLGTDYSSESEQCCLSQIVSIPFFYYEHWKLDIPRGPYAHVQDWLAARLQIAAVEVDNQPVYSDDEDEEDSDNEETAIDDDDDDEEEEEEEGEEEDDGEVETDPHVLLTAKSKHSRIRRLNDLLPKIFPKDKAEEYMLHHQDLSGNNILIDEDHNLAGIIDWECVHTVPLWLGCQIPKFLHSREGDAPPPFRTEFRDERDEKDYWRRVEEHEKTQLREFYVEEMQRVCPEWIQVHEAGAMKADFDFAVNTVSLGATVAFEMWLKQVEQDQEPLTLRNSMSQF